MRFAFFILCSVLASGYSTVASASSREAAAALANCAWERVPETAQALLDKRVKKNIIYDEVGNTLPVHAAPFMRVYAACSDEKATLEGLVGRREVAYRLLRQLKREKPDSVQADTFETPVFVCEARFPDRFEDESAAIVWWGFGEDRFASQLGVKATVFNSQVNITFADIAAIEKRGNGAANFANLLSQTEGQEVIEVETFDGGMASEKAFKITPTEANSKCKLVNARGELINA